MRVVFTEKTFVSLDDIFAEFTVTQEAKQPSAFGRHRIGILGGTFNPPHLGHLMMAEQVGTQLDLDEVWFMPTAKPPHAPGKSTIASQHRLQMVLKAIAGNPLFKLQPYEVNRGGKNYTVDTMRHFVEQYPESEFFFILGSDSVNELHTWREIDQLISLVQFVGIRRPGEDPYMNQYPILWVDSPLIDISSTEIRLRVFLEQSIKYQVPSDVEAYIYKHRLYSNQN